MTLGTTQAPPQAHQDPDRRALVSVYDKTGLDELARGLHDAGVEIVSTGSTAARIRELGVPVTPVDEVTGFPEILGGRVKTLHPNVHAGLLADQNDPDHVATIDRPRHRRHSSSPSSTCTRSARRWPPVPSTPEVIEQIDIGGPAMVRAAAKNHGSLAVVVDPARYVDVLDAVRAGGFDLAARQRLAARTRSGTPPRTTSRSRPGWAAWSRRTTRSAGEATGFPGWVAAAWERAAVLRYGENPHQSAALYVTPGGAGWRRPSNCPARR